MRTSFSKLCYGFLPIFFQNGVSCVCTRPTETFELFFANGCTDLPTQFLTSPNIWDLVLFVLVRVFLIVVSSAATLYIAWPGSTVSSTSVSMKS